MKNRNHALGLGLFFLVAACSPDLRFEETRLRGGSAEIERFEGTWYGDLWGEPIPLLEIREDRSWRLRWAGLGTPRSALVFGDGLALELGYEFVDELGRFQSTELVELHLANEELLVMLSGEEGLSDCSGCVALHRRSGLQAALRRVRGPQWGTAATIECGAPGEHLEREQMIPASAPGYELRRTWWRRSPETSFHQPDSALRTNLGWLVGSDRGEFGGELVYLPDNGEPRVLLHDNVKAIHLFGGGYAVVTGLGHLDMTRGAIVLLEDDNDGTPRIVDILNLPGVPATSWLGPSNALIVTAYGYASPMFRASREGTFRLDQEHQLSGVRCVGDATATR